MILHAMTLLFLTQTPAIEDEKPAEPWTELHVQVRPRAEKAFAGHLGVPGAPGALAGTTNGQVTSRLRVTAEGGVGNARARISVQDVRAWASESSTLADFSAEGIDFHEGWVQIGGDTFLKVGRQEIALDGQRLLGAVNWTQQARSFDGARFGHSAGDYEFTLFAARVADGFRHDLVVAHGATKLGGVRVAVPLFFQTNAMVAATERGSQSDDWHRFTGGVRASADGTVSWRCEAYAQTGTNHFAYMAGARAGMKLHALAQPTLWVDYLSGDHDLADGDSGAFDTLFATNHKFYGYMDRFLAIPGHTRGGGLIDLALKNRAAFGPGNLELALHQFLLAAADTSPSANGEHSPLIGFEVDAVYAAPLSKWLKLVAGAGVFVDQGDFRAERRTASEEAPVVHDWLFVMLDLRI